MPDNTYKKMVRDLQNYLNSVANAGLDPDGSLGGKTARAAEMYERAIKPAKKTPYARIAHCLHKLRSQIDILCPNRSKVADGWIGDAAHAKRKSDHNAKKVGDELVVFALDITHDPANGVDCAVLADALTKDIRTKYIIFRGRIYNAKTNKRWEKYEGNNAHNHHLHISVTDTSDADVKHWSLS